MKKLKNTHWFMTLLVFFVGCSDLEEDPNAFLVESQFLQSVADAEGAIIGAYATLRSAQLYGLNAYYVSDMLSDQVTTECGEASLDEFTFTSENSRIRNIWDGSFIGISRANFIIDNIARVGAPTEETDPIIGEALFLRAFNYFNLARMWGDVPLRVNYLTSIDDVSLEKSPVEAVFAQVIEDLQTAQNILPERSPAGSELRVNQWIAKSLLAKVHLYAENWSDAARVAKDVIDNGPYRLFETYREVWLVANKNQVEHIWSLQNNTANPSGLQSWYTPREGSGGVSGCSNSTRFPGSPRGWFHLPLDLDFFLSFDEDDLRRELTDTTWVNINGDTLVTTPQGLAYSKKYIDVGEPTEAENIHNVNFPILRFADILLIYAEASARENGGPTAESYAAMNQVRNRAFGDTDHELPPGLSLDDFIDAVLQERNWELFTEADRYWDLARTGKFRGLVDNEKFRWLPIPETEIISSSGVVEQNELWR